jgi:hypothetical protein
VPWNEYIPIQEYVKLCWRHFCTIVGSQSDYIHLKAVSIDAGPIPKVSCQALRKPTMSELSELFSAFSNPQMRHAILGHMPIALAILGIPLTLLSALLPKNRTCRMMALVAFAVLAISAWMTVQSGEVAHDAIDKVLTPEVYEEIEKHEEMAEKLWFFALAGVIMLAAADRFTKSAIRTSTAWLAVVTACSATLWVAITAHHGGTLVYTYGVGTPHPVACDEVSRSAADQMISGVQTPATSPSAPTSSSESGSYFHEKVWPIIAERCIGCHNPTRVAARKSGLLDQTSREALMKGGASGAAIVPGKPEESLLITRVKGEDENEDRMPPPSKPPLSTEQIATLEEWIRDGAKWDE